MQSHLDGRAKSANGLVCFDNGSLDNPNGSRTGILSTDSCLLVTIMCTNGENLQVPHCSHKPSISEPFIFWATMSTSLQRKALQIQYFLTTEKENE